MGHGPGGDGRHHPDAGRVARTYVLDAACQRRQDGRHATGTVSPDVRRSTPAAAALAAALTLAACGGGETAAGGATSSSDSTADCEGITAAITDTLTRALDATVEVSLDLDHCEADGLGRWAAVAELTGYRSIVMMAQAGGGASIDVSMPATPYPDLVQFTRDLAAFATDAELQMRLTGTWYPTSLLGTAYRNVSVDDLTAAQQGELDRLVDVVVAWGIGPVSVTIQPVHE